MEALVFVLFRGEYYDLCGLFPGNFGTFIVHADELHQKTTQYADSAVSDSAVPSGTGSRLANSGYLPVCLPSLPISFMKTFFFYSLALPFKQS